MKNLVLLLTLAQSAAFTMQKPEGDLTVTAVAYRVIPHERVGYITVPGRSSSTCFGSGMVVGNTANWNTSCSGVNTPAQTFPLRAEWIEIYNQVTANGYLFTLYCRRSWTGSNCDALTPGDTLATSIQGTTIWITRRKGGNLGKEVTSKMKMLDMRPLTGTASSFTKQATPISNPAPAPERIWSPAVVLDPRATDQLLSAQGSPSIPTNPARKLYAIRTEKCVYLLEESSPGNAAGLRAEDPEVLFAIEADHLFVLGDKEYDTRILKQIPRSDTNTRNGDLKGTDGTTLTNADVVKLKAAGFGDQLIIDKIAVSRGNFHLDTDDLIQLKRAGITDAILSAMLKASHEK